MTKLQKHSCPIKDEREDCSERSWDPQGKGNRFNDLELEEKVG